MAHFPRDAAYDAGDGADHQHAVAAHSLPEGLHQPATPLTNEQVGAFSADPSATFTGNIAPTGWQFCVASISADGAVSIDWEVVERVLASERTDGMAKAIARLLVAARERGRIDVAMRGL